MNTTGDQQIIGCMIRTRIGQQINYRNFQVTPITHSPHGWLIIHDISEPWESSALLQSHVRRHITIALVR